MLTTEQQAAGVAPRIFRPVQFLGSKLRAAAPILDALADIVPRSSAVADIFTGSTVIAQSAARAGYAVTATDALESSAVFARALLGVGRSGPRRAADSWIAEALLPRRRDVEEPWLQLIAAEDEAVARGDGQALIDLSVHLPQIWRPAGTTEGMSEQFRQITAAGGGSAVATGCLTTTHYAGTYFGLRQALDIDAIRCSISASLQSEEIGHWEHDVLLTGLLSAASDCSFSAGKHFAQPHRLRDGKDLTFARRRIVQDRGLSIPTLFAERAKVAWEIGSDLARQHRARRTTLEELRDDHSALESVDVIYADPPYTAQQYSRFYHVLEVLTTYRVPELQRTEGDVTRGLYPTGRFKSRFCSRRQAPEAFRDLCALAQRVGANLVLSYSASTTGHTGNDRIIALRDLEALCRSSFGSGCVEVRKLEHRYRQFNHRDAAFSERNDIEYLIVCRAQ